MIRDEEYREELGVTEQISRLRSEGYRGFTVTGINQKGSGLSVSAVNAAGKTIEASGETLDQAYEELAGRIDYTLDDMI